MRFLTIVRVWFVNLALCLRAALPRLDARALHIKQQAVAHERRFRQALKTLEPYAVAFALIGLVTTYYQLRSDDEVRKTQLYVMAVERLDAARQADQEERIEREKYASTDDQIKRARAMRPSADRGQRRLIEEMVANSVNLSSMDFSKTYLESVRFNQANLAFAVFNGAALSGADFNEADLFGTNFHGAYMQSTNLSGADLVHAGFVGADLVYAVLHNANLTDATLYKADLRFADLTDADLTRTTLLGTRFDRAWYREGAPPKGLQPQVFDQLLECPKAALHWSDCPSDE
ncbi:pentapeptide repeat-containing protein [Thalassobaculum sp.]|uniref:pentapeptide repeat-containing protein n=1 Tax=Thalassobaculum sp. TaxID=2022740 RepID=UPI003B5CCF59